MKALAVTQRDLIRTVAARWRKSYARYGPEWRSQNGTDPAEVYARLAALDPEVASAADVVAIIGNDFWTGQFCNFCREFVGEVVELDPESPMFPDGSSNSRICPACLAEAVRAAEAAGLMGGKEGRP